MLAWVRSALANDAVAASGVTGRSLAGAPVSTDIGYDGAATPRVDSVTLPAPTTTTARPAHSYAYNWAASPPHSQVSVAGLTEPLGFSRKAAFTRHASGGLTVVETDAEGVASTAVYDAGDRLLSSLDGASPGHDHGQSERAD